MIRLFEGGNIFKDEQGVPVTRRINKNEIPDTIKWLEKLTGLDLTKEKAKDGLPTKWLGLVKIVNREEFGAAHFNK
jgi:hypothetical protein